MPTPSEDELLRVAFRDVHGTRLHGFALLVTLGDRRRAADAARQALAEGARRVDELRHPERSAAWLRARVLRSVVRVSFDHQDAPTTEARLAALRPMRIGRSVLQALSTLSTTERAVLVASGIERLAPSDVEAIVDAAPGATRRLIARARARYLAASRNGEADFQPGPLTEGVLRIAARIVSPAGER